MIPLLGRTTALTDALSAVSHDRPSRDGLTLGAVVADIRARAASRSGPVLAEWFVLCVSSGSAALRDKRRRYVSNPLANDPDESPIARDSTGIFKARGLAPGG